MENAKKSLGHGLSALLGDNSFSIANDASDSDVLQVLVSDIGRSRFQPRQVFDETSILELAESIAQDGIIQPLVVREVQNGATRYELIAGERRWRASKRLGMEHVPVIIKNVSDGEALRIALIENIQRKDLSAVEEAETYKKLMDMFSYSQENLANQVGKSRSHIANTLRLLSLPERIQAMVKENVLSAGHARSLIGLPNAEELADKIVNQNLNVRQVEELSKKTKGKAGSIVHQTVDPDILQIQEQIAAALNCEVKIAIKSGQAVVSLKLNSLDDLDSFMNKVI